MLKHIFVIALLLCSLPAQALEVKASRPAEKDCEWHPFTNDKLAISLLVQRCFGDINHLDRCSFEVDNEWVVHRCPEFNGAKATENRLFAVMKKSSDKVIDLAIAQEFMWDLQGEQKVSCKLMAYNEPYFKTQKTYQLFNIIPTAPLEQGANGAEASKPACGKFSNEGDIIKYFEYHPMQTKRRYIYFTNKTDDHLYYDEKSITFTRP